MKLASYNVENLFQRAKAMNADTWKDGAKVLAMHAELNGILAKATYTAADKKKIVELMKKLGIDRKDDGRFVILRQNRGHLVKRPRSGGLEVVANGRGDWIGWIDLVVEEVNEVATQNTARVIRELAADVLGIVEAENRPGLLRFSANVLKQVGGYPYEHVMLIDGNDDRGIDVALMTRRDYPILTMRSHVDDRDDSGLIFSRDCAEYTVETATRNRLVLLINHLKSKGYGSQAAANAKRERQAGRIKAIYDEVRRNGAEFVAVMGDFNDTPDSAPLAPLLKGTDLEDVSRPRGFRRRGPSRHFRYRH